VHTWYGGALGYVFVTNDTHGITIRTGYLVVSFFVGFGDDDCWDDTRFGRASIRRPVGRRQGRPVVGTVTMRCSARCSARTNPRRTTGSSSSGSSSSSSSSSSSIRIAIESYRGQLLKDTHQCFILRMHLVEGEIHHIRIIRIRIGVVVAIVHYGIIRGTRAFAVVVGMTISMIDDKLIAGPLGMTVRTRRVIVIPDGIAIISRQDSIVMSIGTTVGTGRVIIVAFDQAVTSR